MDYMDLEGRCLRKAMFETYSINIKSHAMHTVHLKELTFHVMHAMYIIRLKVTFVILLSSCCV